jgi:thiol-disulfide isomerase/thioredoxin
MKGLGALIFLLIFGNAFSQELIPLNNLDDVVKLKESKKGKVLLVNFWATWCIPCVKEFPDLVRLYNEYKEKEFEIIFISVDVPEDAEGKVKPFLTKNGVEFISYYNNFSGGSPGQNVEELLDYIDREWSGAIPATYIYNREGVLTSRFVGRQSFEDFEREVKKNLD